MSALLDAGARGATALAGAAMLVLALAMPLVRRVGPAAGLLAGQAAFLALALLAQGWRLRSWELAALALGTLAVKVVALPRVARTLAPALQADPGEGGGAQGVLAAALAGGLAVLALVLAAPAAGALAAQGLAVVLAGGLAAVLRRDALGRAAGVMVLENGLVLMLAGVPAVPGIGLLALATLALPAALVVALLRRVLPDPGEAG